jgi:hypothetical protein
MPLVVVVRKDLPANTADELITLARNSKGNPALSYGSVGIGSFYHVLAEHMAQTINAKMTHVPYPGVAPLLQDLAGGNVDFAILPHFAGIDGLVKKGRVDHCRDGQSARRDSAQAAHGLRGKTAEELRLLDLDRLHGQGNPADVISALQKAIHASLSDPAVRESMRLQSQVVAKPMTLDESAKVLQRRGGLLPPYRQGGGHGAQLNDSARNHTQSRCSHKGKGHHPLSRPTLARCRRFVTTSIRIRSSDSRRPAPAGWWRKRCVTGLRGRDGVGKTGVVGRLR